jgi:small-conductance mechanosensitive channel
LKASDNSLDNDEEKKKEELRQQAKKELDQINAQRKSLLDQRKKHNR